MADLATPQSFVDFIESLPAKTHSAISAHLDCIRQNLNIRPVAPVATVVSDLLPQDTLSLHIKELEANGWTEEQIRGENPNPAEASILQILRTGSKIIKIEPSYVKIQHKTGSVVHHDKPHRHIG